MKLKRPKFLPGDIVFYTNTHNTFICTTVLRIIFPAEIYELQSEAAFYQGYQLFSLNDIILTNEKGK